MWWLLRDTDSDVTETRVAALDQLLARLRNHKLAAKQLRAVAENGLAIQADLRRSWDPRWEQWMELAERTRSLSDAQWRRYAAQSTTVLIAARPSVVRGEPAPLEIHCFSNHRGAIYDTFCAGGTLYLNDIAVTDLQPSPVPVGVLVLPEKNGGRNGSPQSVRLKATVTASVDRRFRGNRRNMPPGLPTVSFEATATVTWALTDTPPPVRFVTDAGRQSEESSVRITRATWSRLGEVAVTLQLSRLPIPIAADVVARRGSREWVLGSVLLPAGRWHDEDVRCLLPDFDPAADEVILRPNAALTRQVIEPVPEIWATEIPFPVRFRESGPLRHE